MAEAYKIAREFSEGYAAAMRPDFIDAAMSPHWHAGYEAAYGQREVKNRLLNEYLVSVGEQPMGVIHLAEKSKQ